MYINQRQYNLISICINDNNSHDVDVVINNLGVSIKTLKKDVDIINNEIKEFESSINIVDNELVFSTMYSNTHWNNLLMLSKRIDEISLINITLLLKKDYISLMDLSYELYISKSKLEKIITNNPYKFDKLSKVRNLGVYYDIDEVEKVRLIFNILRPFIDPVNYLISIRQLLSQVVENKISMEVFKKATDKFNQYDLTTYLDIKAQELFLIILLTELNYFTFNVDIVLNELLNGNDEVDINLLDIEVKSLLDLENIYNYDLNNYNNLINHLKRAITYNNDNIKLEDKFISDLTREFGYSIDIASRLLSNLGFKFSVSFNQYEKYFVSIYLQTLIEEVDRVSDLNILIVCQYGISVSNYIKYKLDKLLYNNINITTSSIYLYHKNKNNNYDLILTTLNNLENDYSQVEVISAVPTVSELEDIKNIIMTKSYMNILNNIVNDNILINNKDYHTHLDIINDNKELLLSYVSDGYIKSLENRIKQGLDVYNNTIIYHADSKYVLKNQLIIINNLDNFENSKCSTIFILLLTDKFIRENKSFIKYFYKLIGSDEYMKFIHNMNNTNQLKYIFNTIIRN